MKKTRESLRNILVIEDDEPTREAILLKLSQSGYEADSAENVETGLEKLRNGNFKGVLLDLLLPKQDGFVFLEKKQQSDALLKIPVMVFSNLSQPESVNRALALGAKGYLVKAHHSIQEMVKEVGNCFLKKQCRIDQ